MLRFITLVTPEVERARRFYQDALQLPLLREGEGLVFLDLGGSTLALITAEALERETGLGPAGAAGAMLLSWNLPERRLVEETLAKVEPAGGRVLRPAAETAWGAFAAFFADPDGHRWELAWNPRRPAEPAL